MMKPIRLFYLSVAIAGLAVGAYLLLMSCQTPPPPAPPPVAPPPSPVVETKPATTDFPIADATVAKLKELFGKPEAIETFCYGKEPLEPLLKYLHETSDVLMRHVVAEKLPPGDTALAVEQLIEELGRYRSCLWLMVRKMAPATWPIREISRDSLLNELNRPRSCIEGMPSPMLDGPLVIVYPDGRRRAAYWSNNRLYEQAAVASTEPVPPNAAGDRCLRLYDELSNTLATWQGARWTAMRKPNALTDLCELFFLWRQNTPSQAHDIREQNDKRIYHAFVHLGRNFNGNDSSQPLPELTWNVNPRLPDFFLPILKRDPEALKMLRPDFCSWSSSGTWFNLQPASATVARVRESCEWVRDYIMACASTPQPPASQPVVDGLVKEMVAQLKNPPATWDDWVVQHSIVMVLDHWRNMVWLWLDKPPELAQAYPLPRTWFEVVLEMMTSNPPWAASLLEPQDDSPESAIKHWDWSDGGNQNYFPLTCRAIINQGLLDRLDQVWKRQEPFLLPHCLCPYRDPFLLVGPLASPFTGTQSLPNRRGDMLIPVKMRIDDICVRILNDRLVTRRTYTGMIDGQRLGYYHFAGLRLADEAGAVDRLLKALAARYQNLALDQPAELLQKEQLRGRLLQLRRALKPCETLDKIDLPEQSFLFRPEFKKALPSPDDIIKPLPGNNDIGMILILYEKITEIDQDYFKTHDFSMPLDDSFVQGFTAMLPPRVFGSGDPLFKTHEGLLVMLDRRITRLAQGPALPPGSSQESFDKLVLSLFKAISSARRHNREQNLNESVGATNNRGVAIGRQLHQLLSRWRDAKGWTALSKPRCLRRLPSLEAFKPVPLKGFGNYHDDLCNNPYFIEELLFRLAEGQNVDKELKILQAAQDPSFCRQALIYMVPDQEFVTMIGKLMTRKDKDDPEDWKWRFQQQIILQLHLVILGRVAQETLSDGCTPEDIARLVEQMTTCYQGEKNLSIRLGLAMSLYTLQQAPWQAMPMPEKLKALNLVPDLPPEAKKLMAP